MKRFFGVVCIFALLCAMLPVSAVAAETTTVATDTLAAFGKYYLPEVNTGGVFEAATLQDCITDIRDGVNYLYSTSTGANGAVFNVINLDTKQVEGSYVMPGGSKVWRHVKDSKGRIYMVHSRLYCYDPETKEMTDLGRFSETDNTSFTLCIDENDTIYIGTYPNAKIIKYDPDTNAFEDWGTVLEGMQYIRTIAYHKGYLYCGVYASPPGKMVRVEVANPQNKTVFEAPKSHLYEPSQVKWFYESNVIGDLIVCYVNIDNSRIFLFDTVKGQWVDNGYEGLFKGLFTTPEKDGKAYFGYRGMWQEIDVATGMISDFHWTTENYAIWGGGWVELKGYPDFPGKSFVTIDQTQNLSHLVFFNFETKKVMVWDDIDMKGSWLSLLYIGNTPGGGIHAASGGAPKNHWFDPATGESADFMTGQIEGAVPYNGKIYLGAYTSARIYEYDPTQPYVKDVNPKQVGIVTEQDRPFAMDAGDGIVCGGTIAKYGNLAGSLFIYDTKTGEFFEENNVVNNQSIMGIAYKDGLIYGSTTVHGGLGCDSASKEKEAKIFVYDAVNKKKIKEFVPKFETIDVPVTHIGDLEFGPDGKLWGTTGFTLFSIDVETETIHDEMIFGEFKNFGYENHYWMPTYLKFDDKGNIYANLNGIRVINPKTREHKQLTSYACARYTFGNDGNLYMGVGTDIRVLPVLDAKPTFDYNSYAQKFLNTDKLMLKVGNPVASAGGKPQYIDPANPAVAPIVENDRTLIPIRFIAESLGATVSWNDATQTATLVKDDTNVSIKIGENKITVNGSSIPLDVPAQLKNERTLLPLRAVSDAFGKNVHWEDCGLIVISDETQSFSEEQVLALNNYFKFYIKNNIVDEELLAMSRAEYAKLLSSLGGTKMEVPNSSFEQVGDSGIPTNFTLWDKDNCRNPEMASISNSVVLNGERSLRINDSSPELGCGFETDLIEVDCSKQYKLIVPIFAASGKTCFEVTSYNSEGKKVYNYANYYRPTATGIWEFAQLDIPMKGNPKYIRIRLMNTEGWVGDCYYDDFTLLELQ